MSTNTSTLQAVFQADPSSKHLELKTLQAPTPSRDDHHVIAVHATAACRDELGWELADPEVFETSTRERVPRVEGSGVVKTAPTNSPFKAGDAVFFTTDAFDTGAARALTLVHTAQLARKPDSLDWAQAAATPLSALSAWQGLFEHGTLDEAAITAHDAGAKAANAKKRVLITGAGGGVGSWAVKLAHAAGAHVIALCSGAKAAAVRGFGADEVIDYKTTSVDAWAAKNPHADLVFDCAGGDVLPTLWAAVKDGGAFIAVTGDPGDSRPEGRDVDAKWFLVNTRRNLADIGRLIDEKKLTPLVDSVFPFERFAEVWQKADEGRTAGKVVLTVAN